MLAAMAGAAAAATGFPHRPQKPLPARTGVPQTAQTASVGIAAGSGSTVVPHFPQNAAPGRNAALHRLQVTLSPRQPSVGSQNLRQLYLNLARNHNGVGVLRWKYARRLNRHLVCGAPRKVCGPPLLGLPITGRLSRRFPVEALDPEVHRLPSRLSPFPAAHVPAPIISAAARPVSDRAAWNAVAHRPFSQSRHCRHGKITAN